MYFGRGKQPSLFGAHTNAIRFWVKARASTTATTAVYLFICANKWAHIVTYSERERETARQRVPERTRITSPLDESVMGHFRDEVIWNKSYFHVRFGASTSVTAQLLYTHARMRFRVSIEPEPNILLYMPVAEILPTDK